MRLHFIWLFGIITVGVFLGLAASVEAQAPGIGVPSPAPASGPSTVQQQSSAGETPKTIDELDPLKSATLYTVSQRIIRAFLGFVGALALLVFVYAGITWMTAGSSDRIQKAKDSMKYAVIGLALIVFAYAITSFFIKTLAGG